MNVIFILYAYNIDVTPQELRLLKWAVYIASFLQVDWNTEVWTRTQTLTQLFQPTECSASLLVCKNPEVLEVWAQVLIMHRVLIIKS